MIAAALFHPASTTTQREDKPCTFDAQRPDRASQPNRPGPATTARGSEPGHRRPMLNTTVGCSRASYVAPAFTTIGRLVDPRAMDTAQAMEAAW